MNEFDEARLEMADDIDASMRDPIRVTSQDSPPVVRNAYASYRSPTTKIYGQQDSQDHQIEYRASFLPGVREGDLVEILDGVGIGSYHVREAPFTQNDLLAHGDSFWLRCLLTKI